MKRSIYTSWFFIIILALIVLIGGYFRFVGIYWDENYHLHPDERFLTMVETSLASVKNIAEYFNTEISTLNPHNVRDMNGNQTFPFFVYGTFPIFLVRYVGEIISKTSYSEIHIIGRYLSGIFDLGTILLVFFTAKELFKKTRIALLASFFYACAALPIQISHFFIVDNFTTFFSMLAFFSAVKIFQLERVFADDQKKLMRNGTFLGDWSGVKYYLLFSLALGFAAASKINAVVAAFLLPAVILFSGHKNYFSKLNNRWKLHIKYLILAAILSLVVFRIFQPYAFSGPGYFNISLNPKWINNIKELSALSSGLSNYPPSLQWTRRSFLFPLKNMFVWGMGIPFGIASIVGICLMGWRMIKGEMVPGRLLIVWTALYIVWQAFRWNPTMRYFLLVYPTCAVIAGWFIDQLLICDHRQKRHKNLPSIVSLLAVLIIILTFFWGFGFTDIYRHPMTRIDASEWIYRNIEGAVNLQITNDEEQFTQPIPFPKYYSLNPDQTLAFEYSPEFNVEFNQIAFDHIIVKNPTTENQLFSVRILSKNTQETLGEINISENFRSQTDTRGEKFVFEFPSTISFKTGQAYIISITSHTTDDMLQFSGTMSFMYPLRERTVQKSILEFAQPLDLGEPYVYVFSPIEDGVLTSISFFRVRPLEIGNDILSLSIEIRDTVDKKIIAEGELNDQFSQFIDFRGQNFSVMLDQSLTVKKGSSYELLLTLNENSAAPILLNGSKTAKETDWDDALPLFMYGFNPFDYYSGVYQSDLNFQMYWDDDEKKFTNFTSNLDQADYILFSSSRQWGSVTQAPEKYPLSAYFYKQIIGCELDEVQKCYVQAEPGSGSGSLEFSLEKVFKSEPHILGLEINTQYAEEAFSVYDHPKVFIFKKMDGFSFDRVATALSSVDISKALNISPQEIEKRPGLLLLPESMVKSQKVSGTWSQLFSYESWQNKNPALTVVIWYLFFTILGWGVYPIVRIVFKGLKDKGWAVSRLVGLILLTFIVWMIGSIGFEVSRGIIAASVLILLFCNGIIFLLNKNDIVEEIKNNWQLLLISECFSLVFFIFFLLIRIGNPDLWHPYKGGEKPMDFSYFNAIIKSINFPPYDPWYSGGYINYYYWGLLLAAVPTKLLGIIPSIAYNLILPCFFSFTALGAYCVGSNLAEKSLLSEKKIYMHELISGLAAVVFLLLIGNLGTVKMILQGFTRLVGNSNPSSTTNVFIAIGDFVNGVKVFLEQGRFNYYPGDWYWIPSRAIPGEPITEFPFFTFLYGDPHAHLFALPITLLALVWTISLLNERMRYQNMWDFVVKLLIGALIIGSLRPTNTWDYPVSLAVSGLGIFYVMINYTFPSSKIFPHLTQQTRRLVLAITCALVFCLFSFIFFTPFSKWFGQGYTAVEFWKGDKTPIGSYLTHWGLFIFVIYSWMVQEVVHWMKETPLAELRKFYPRRNLFFAAFIFLFVLFIELLAIGIHVVIIIFPILVILPLLLIRKRYSDTVKFILLLTIIGISLTLTVEVIVLTGDIGRMNTVFKFYLQAWTCLSLSASWYIIQLLERSKKWVNKHIHNAWRVILIVLFTSALLFPIFAGSDKITDRISHQVPLTLDGMDYMRFSTYVEDDQEMDLGQDYDLIRWMQHNITGTPTIIEANVPEYRWGNRVSIYTGLPGVVGWNWHQRQQRVINPPEWVFERVNDVNLFYSTTEFSTALVLVEKYNIEYVVIGQLEKILYPPEGIQKFFLENNDVFETIYASEDTYIVKVNK